MKVKKVISKTWITTPEALKFVGLSENSYSTFMKYWKLSGVIERKKLSHKNVKWGLESLVIFNNSHVLGGDEIQF